jgi:hypothetical protein
MSGTGKDNVQKDGLQRVLDFLEFLRDKGIEFTLGQQQPEAIMVTFAMVGFRIEVEFFTDHLEYSVFRGNEDVESDERALYDLVRKNWS